MNERQRLQQIMEAEKLNAKQFAEEVGISAGTISNIMGGRNNPSLDVLQAVLNRFRTINSDWLILGIGAMYRPNGDGPQTALFDIKPENPQEPSGITNTTQSEKTPISSVQYKAAAAQSERKVAKIVIYYTDGTYEER
ncbi:MAG: helix-turn-helix domain-containing protein [Paludibacteraceae bacterium]|nr:helix-turn-helix domain-containing protein [Paludibacteraceae bacterium]